MFALVRSAFADALPYFLRRPRAEQFAALCQRDTVRGPEVLLVTSSRGRWILPKGWPIDGQSPAETAAQEAWEEAGVRARDVAEEPLGRFETVKRRKNGEEVICDTAVYELEVEKLSSDFPEADRRERRWVPLDKAADEVDDEALSEMLRSL